MKKCILMILLAAAMLLCLAACKPNIPETPVSNPEPDQPQAEAVPDTFPEGTVICGVDISDLTAADAAAAVADRLETYDLTLQLGGQTFSFESSILKLKAGSLDYEELLQSCYSESGVKVVDSVFTYDLSAIRNLLAVLQEEAVPSKNAFISFSEQENAFVLNDEAYGTQFDAECVLRLAEDALLELKDTLALGVEDVFFGAEITAESEEAQTALANANAMLNTVLTYRYQPGSALLGTETLDKTTTRSWFVVEEDGLTVTVDPGPVNDYVNRMYEAYSLSNSTSTFVTSGGEEIQVRVPSPGETVDTDALYNDIVEGITTAASGERNAPYIPEDEEFTADFGGTYVEINLTKQHLWVYKNGSLVVETDIVSGCVNTGHATPAGIYTIKDKERDRYLIGPGYKSWVNYWMPFNGGIGLHDADGWRWSYGGSIYLYSGSHGCINMPKWAVSKAYDAVSVGTYVILYGGVGEVAPLTQSLSGTKSYTVKVGDPNFTLDAKPYYKIEKMTYESSDPSVVTVNASGVVTVVGAGKATITVTAVAEQGYTEAKMAVTVTVNTKCSLGEHEWDAGKVTLEPACNLDGIRTYSCKECEATKTEPIPKIGHTSNEGVIATPATCGADGVKIFSCTVCGEEVKKESVPATGKHTAGEAVVTTQPTCTKDGVRTVSCSVCGKPISTEPVPATGIHIEDGGTVTTQPTCAAEGVRTYCCTGCGGELRTEAIPVTGHTPDTGTVQQEPTCTTEGIMAHSCLGCGTALPSTPIPATGHNMVDGACTVCGAPETPPQP